LGNTRTPMSTAKGKSEAESEKRLEYLRKRAYKNLKSRELCGVERERERERERVMALGIIPIKAMLYIA
jgi:hypothetical protein